MRSAMRRRSSFAATPGMARTSPAKSEVVSTTGSASDRRPGPARPGTLHVAADHHKVGRVTQEAVNRRDNHHIPVSKDCH